MKVISFNATKGGTGKSTLSIITVNGLIRAGFKVLAIDTDTVNHSLSFYFNAGIPFDTIQQRNIFKVFAGGTIQDNTLRITDRLDLVHGDVRLSDFRSIDTLKRLKRSIQGLEYDYVIIDTAPTYDNITANVLTASDTLVVPVIPDVFNLQSVRYLFGKLADLELSDLDIQVMFNQYERPRSDNAGTFSNQVLSLFTKDKTIQPFISAFRLSKSGTVKKYINDRGYRINDRKETARANAEIKDLLKNITGTVPSGGI